MLDALLPFLTLAREDPDFNGSDWQAELDAYVFRQQAIQSCVTGELDASTLLDILESQGVDPVEYCQMATSNVDRAIDAGVKFEEAESLLILP